MFYGILKNRELPPTMKNLLSLILLLLIVQKSHAQNYTIKGSVTDTFINTPLYRASIVLIRTTDSVIESFTRTGMDGRFEIRAGKKGKYLLRISYPGFVDFLDLLDVKKTTTDVGEKPLVSKEHLLKEFVLTQQIAAIKITGDTTEYMADSFKVKENATVEDLLKKLPGIQVDKNGNITAQGETVQKIYVDGEEFFSDDPKVVTQGLQANAVSKVQVFDKKSEQAEFTGIDDGQKTKTINLELKEDKKKGYFGKLDAGAGTDNYYQEQGMINAFKAKRQLSAFAVGSNTDKVGLGWQDADKFGGGSGGTTEITEEGGIVTYYSNSDDDFNGWSGKYNGEGLPKTLTGGLHFADKWNGDINHVTANYRAAQQNVDIEGGNIAQTILKDKTSSINDQTKHQASKGIRHGFDAMYEVKLDSLTTLKITATAGLKQTEISSDYLTIGRIKTDTTTVDINRNERNITSTADASFVNADLLLKKKFRKKGRTISVDVKENYKDSQSDGLLTSNTFETLSNDTTRIDQKKENLSNTLAFSARATYTEPLSKKVFAEIDYGVTVNNNEGKNNSFNKNPITNLYDALDSAHSSDYKYNILSNTGGLNFKFNYEKLNFSFGSDVSNANYHQTNIQKGGIVSTFNYFNLFPKVNFTYKVSKQTSFNFSYSGSTVQPTFNYVQPITQNSDPLHITVGNPDLKQGFDHRISARFNDYKVLQSRYLWTSFSFWSHDNAISMQHSYFNGIDSAKYINVQGNYSGWGYIGYGMKLKKLDVDAGVHVSGGIDHTNSRIGTPDASGKLVYVDNASDNNSVNFTAYINKNKTDKYDFSLEPGINYTSSVSTAGKISTNYHVYSCELRGTVQLPLKFEIGSSVNLKYRENTSVFTGNNDVVIWNAWMGKKFLKKSQLELRASVFDLLDQNIGYNRTSNDNMTTQDNYNTIRRYGMLNLIWNFTHTPAGAPQQNNTMMIMH